MAVPQTTGAYALPTIAANPEYACHPGTAWWLRSLVRKTSNTDQRHADRRRCRDKRSGRLEHKCEEELRERDPGANVGIETQAQARGSNSAKKQEKWPLRPSEVAASRAPAVHLSEAKPSLYGWPSPVLGESLQMTPPGKPQIFLGIGES